MMPRPSTSWRQLVQILTVLAVMMLSSASRERPLEVTRRGLEPFDDHIRRCIAVAATGCAPPWASDHNATGTNHGAIGSSLPNEDGPSGSARHADRATAASGCINVSAVHCLMDAYSSGWAPSVDSTRESTVSPSGSESAEGVLRLSRRLPHLQVPLVVTASDPRQTLSGIQWLPDRWELVDSTAPATRGVWQQVLSDHVVTESGTIEQLFAGQGADVQWMPEARWPSAYFF
jgi:hypothetical protein